MTDTQTPPTEELDILLGELVDDYLRRLARGERPAIEQYATAHPELSAIIRQTFPALEVVNESASRRIRGEGVDLSSSRQLGDFRLLRELGAGGMGFVYEAEQLSMGRRIALKILPMAGALQQKSLQRFRNEVRAAAMLDHPNIVSVYSVGEDRGVHYYAMQLIRGQSLADVIQELALLHGKRRPLDGDSIGHIASREGQPTSAGGIDSTGKHLLKRADAESGIGAETRISSFPQTGFDIEYFRSAARLGIQAAEALQHAHDQGVLHRDVKPGNLLLDADLCLYITDFGLARIEADAGITMTGDLVGTLRYMSPEQALAKRVVVDHRSDLYSLGMTFYELLTLCPAYDATNRHALLRQIAFDEPKKPRHLNRQIPRELEIITLKSIAKNPDERYPTAQALADDLRAFLESRPIKARPQTLTQRSVKWIARHPGVAWSAILLLALVSIGSTVGSLLVWREKEVTAGALVAQADALDRERAARQRETVARRKETDARHEATRSANVAQQNLYLAHMRQAQQDWNSGQTDRLHHLLEQHLPEPGEFDRRRWEWYYLLSLTKQDLLTYREHADSVRSVAWSPDGKRVASSNWLEVQVFDSRTGETLHTLRGHSGSVHAVAWSPDGGRIASGGSDGTVRIWDAESGVISSVKRTPVYVSEVAWSPNGRYLALGGAGVRSGKNSYFLIWDMEQDREHLRQELSDKMSVHFAWSPDSSQVAVGCRQRIGVWQVDARRELHQWHAHANDTWTLSWSPDGTRLASGAFTKEVKVWDTSTWKEQFNLIHDSGVNSVAWSPDGERMAIATVGQKVLIRDKEGKELAVLRGHVGRVYVNRWSPDGERLASAGEDRTVKIWATTIRPPASKTKETSELRQERVGDYTIEHEPGSFAVRSLANADETLLEVRGSVHTATHDSRLAIGYRQTLEIWDLETGTREHTQQIEESRFWQLAWNPQGDRLSFATFNGMVKVIDARDYRTLHTLRGHTGRHFVSVLAWSADGRKLATAGWDTRIVLWDTRTGEALQTLMGHTGRITRVAWHPDGTRLASQGSNPRSVRIWDTATGSEVLTLETNAAFDRLHWTADGTQLVAGTQHFDARRGFDADDTALYASQRGWRHVNFGKALEWSQLGPALDEYTSATELQADEPTFWLHRAHAELKLGQIQAGLDHCEQALALIDSGSGRHVGRVSLALQRVSAFLTESAERPELENAMAHRLATKAVELAGHDATGWRILGFAEYRVGNWDATVTAMEKCNSLRSGNKAAMTPTTAALTALALWKRGEKELAMSAYVRAFRLTTPWLTSECDTVLGGTTFGRAAKEFAAGKTDLRQGELDRALESFRRCVQIEPGYFAGWTALADAYEKQQKFADSERALREALKIRPDNKYAIYNLGWALQQQGRLEEALEAFQRDADLYPNESQIQLGLGIVLDKLERRQEAIDAYRKALSIDPQRFATHCNLAIALYEQGDVKQAEKILRQGIEIAPRVASGHSNLGLMLEKQGKTADAVIAYQTALELAPENMNTMNSLAWLLCTAADEELRNPERAVRLARRVTQRTPEDRNAWNTLGAALYRNGQLRESIDALQESMELSEGGDAYDWLFMAMAHHQLEQTEQAQQWFDKAITWMDQQSDQDDQLERLRTEARDELGIE